MSFIFSLERMLDHKRTLEDAANRDWSEAQARVNQAMKELDGFYDQVDEARKRAAIIEAGGGQKASELGMIDDFIGGQKIRVERQRTLIRELMTVAEQKQDLLIEAARERKTLEKLRESQLAEYRLKRKKQELKRNDELVVTRFGKKLLGEGEGLT